MGGELHKYIFECSSTKPKWRLVRRQRKVSILNLLRPLESKQPPPCDPRGWVGSPPKYTQKYEAGRSRRRWAWINPKGSRASYIALSIVINMFPFHERGACVRWLSFFFQLFVYIHFVFFVRLLLLSGEICGPGIGKERRASLRLLSLGCEMRADMRKQSLAPKPNLSVGGRECVSVYFRVALWAGWAVWAGLR